MPRAKKPKRYYKIRDMKTGLYKMGGCSSMTWRSDGKLWKGMGSINRHIKDVMRYGRIHIDEMSLWEVVEYSLTETDVIPCGAIASALEKNKMKNSHL